MATAEYHRNYYAKMSKDKKKRKVELQNERRTKIKQLVDKIKSDRGCKYCLETDFRCLDFHHVKEKKSTISDLYRCGNSIEKIQLEIDKCEVVCANCHRKLHN